MIARSKALSFPQHHTCLIPLRALDRERQLLLPPMYLPSGRGPGTAQATLGPKMSGYPMTQIRRAAWRRLSLDQAKLARYDGAALGGE
eukprot:COSAG05_NODE_459_length_9617_cov_12.484661_4_plen_88_part_00